MKSLSTAVPTLFLAAAQLASLAAAGPDGFRPPANLQVDPRFEPVLERMWQASPTFRRQCQRLAAEPTLQVKVLVDETSGQGFADAHTALTFQANEPVFAKVFVKLLPTKVPELIAHELEHILEHLDRVDLEAQAGNGAVWKSDRTSFETRRAIETGRRVAREVMDGAEASVSLQQIRSGDEGHVVATMRQREGDASPLSPRTARVSADGHFVVFVSTSSLVNEDRNQLRDVYITDLASGRTTLESIGPGGAAGNGESTSADISGTGRFVVFESQAGDLTETQLQAGTSHVFLRDRATGTTRLLTTNTAGHPANGSSRNPVISADGAVVALESAATDLVEAHDRARAAVGVYVISLATDNRVRIDVPATGRSGAEGPSMTPSISADGRFVVFTSKADLTCADGSGCVAEPPDRNRLADVYLWDTQSKTTRRISRSLSGADTDGASYDPAISGDGRYVTFVSEASNLTHESNGRTAQVYLQDLASGRTELISHTVAGRPANGGSARPAISLDGSTIAFQSLATNLLCEGKCPQALTDFNLLWDVFVYDRRSTRTTRLSSDRKEGWIEGGRAPSIDDTGRLVSFGSRHPIDASDTACDEDLYVMRYLQAPVSSAAITTRSPKR